LQDGVWDLGKRHAILHDPATNKHIVSDKIRNAVDRWTEGKFKALCIRSAMGTGKSCFMVKLLDLLFRKSPDLKVLVITYRQTLAQELEKKLLPFQFQNYLACQNCDLNNRERTRDSSYSWTPCPASKGTASSLRPSTTWWFWMSSTPSCATLTARRLQNLGT
jgi:hypothetical protein